MYLTLVTSNSQCNENNVIISSTHVECNENITINLYQFNPFLVSGSNAETIINKKMIIKLP